MSTVNSTFQGIYHDTKSLYSSINPQLIGKCAVTAPICAIFVQAFFVTGPVGVAVGVAIPIAFYATTKCDRQWFDFSKLKKDFKESFPIHVKGNLIAIAFNVTIIFFTTMLGLKDGGQIDHKIAIRQMMQKGLLWVLYAEFVIIGPLMEEILFRGLIMDMIYEAQRRWCDETANSKFQKMTRIALQGIIFGVAHFRPSQGWGNISIICSITVAGTALGYMREKTNNLAMSYFFHALNNFIATTILVLSLK